MVKPMCVALRGRLHDPEYIDQPRDQDPDGGPDQAIGVSLTSAKRAARNGIANIESASGGQVLPESVGAVEIPDRFLGQVRRPGDDELRSREIGPENDKGEHQLAQVMQDRRVDAPAETSPRETRIMTMMVSAKVCKMSPIRIIAP